LNIASHPKRLLEGWGEKITPLGIRSVQQLFKEANPASHNIRRDPALIKQRKDPVVVGEDPPAQLHGLGVKGSIGKSLTVIGGGGGPGEELC
jgi:hypothetical protein